jgi:hypothetical protein
MRCGSRAVARLAVVFVLIAPAAAQIITTVAGTTFTFPSSPVPALNAPLGSITGVAVDANGSVYVADPYNNIVERFTPGGLLTVVAGNGISGFSGDGGLATNASLYLPYGVAVDSAGNVYIADTGNARVRKVSNGTITTVAGNGYQAYSGDGGPPTSATMYFPTGVAVDSTGNLYIADSVSNVVREVSGGTITTVAGNGNEGFSGDGGPAVGASLNDPVAVAVDSAGNLYIADSNNCRIRKVSNGTITTVAGDANSGFSGDGGPAGSASLNAPSGVAVDSGGNLYIADSGNNRIRKVSGGTIVTIAGNGNGGFSGDGGPATNASLALQFGGGATTYGVIGDRGSVAVDSAGNLYIGDLGNDRVRQVSYGAGTSGTITTVAGDGDFQFSGDGGPATSASLNAPQGVAVDSAGNLYFADSYNNRIRKVSSGGTITTVAGNGIYGYSGDGGPATSASLRFPSGVAVDSAGNLYIADWNNMVIRKVSNGIITTVAGYGGQGFSGDGGPATSAVLSQTQGVAVDLDGNFYIADLDNSRIRKVSNGTITTVAGNGKAGFSGDGGPATSASLNSPAE